jgi:Predicted membrane protein (DUF2134).
MPPPRNLRRALPFITRCKNERLKFNMTPANFQFSRHSNHIRRRGGLRGVRPNKLNREEGVIIVLVAVFMLGAVGAMAALSIDVITLYTARSEAQLTADAGALAAARALANSGATSDPSGNLMTLAEPLASKVAIQVAQSSYVGGRYLDASKGEVVVSFSDSQNNPCIALHPITNPCVTVSVQRIDLPTFFARIWGASEVKVATSATAEAYNPTNISGGGSNPNPPVAPICVKPWLLPNIDPTNGTTTIFDPGSGAVNATTLLGYTASGAPQKVHVRNVNAAIFPAAWKPYSSDSVSFPVPADFPACAPSMTTDYQKSIAGCVQTPIACNVPVNIQLVTNGNINADTANAVNCLTHATNNNGDSVSPQTNPPTVPFEFNAGSDNPIPNANGNDVMVSDSLVTVPVVNLTATPTPWPPTTQLQIIGFVQLFLNSTGNNTNTSGGGAGRIDATVVNLVGCGTSATGTPIFGNGASPVAVRLVSP